MRTKGSQKNTEGEAEYLATEAAYLAAGEKSDDAYDTCRAAIAAFAVADAHFAEARAAYRAACKGTK